MSPATPGLRKRYAVFNTALRSLYEHDLLYLAKDGKSDDLGFNDDVFMEAAKAVYKNGALMPSALVDSTVKALSDETMRILDDTIDGVLRNGSSPTIRYALKYHARMFSGFKTYYSLMGAGLAIKTKDGDKRPMEDFLSDAEKVNRAYNHNYLYAERNQAAAAAQMADKWHDIEKDGDKYNLQYRTANDDKVREEHARLHGITLPPSDPFWDKYYPPNGWNCRCTAVQVRVDKYPKSDPVKAMSVGDSCTSGAKREIFRYNIGKSMDLFPTKHPYYKAPEGTLEAVNGYVPGDFTAKTVKEAENLIKKTFGINCRLDGLTKSDMKEIEEIYRSCEKHFLLFPQLARWVQFIGTYKGRKKLLVEAKFQELKAFNPDMDDNRVLEESENFANTMTQCTKTTFAGSEVRPILEGYGANGIVINQNKRGEKLYDDLKTLVETKWFHIGGESFKSIMDHEFGHQLDFIYDFQKNCANFKQIKNEAYVKGINYIEDSLSRYALNKNTDFLAEAWSECNNNKMPRPLASAVAEALMEFMKEKN